LSGYACFRRSAAQAGDDNAGDDQQGDEDAAPVQSNDGECRGSYQRGECAEPAHQAMGVFLAGLSVFSGHRSRDQGRLAPA
jgi:hypothetical protein